MDALRALQSVDDGVGADAGQPHDAAGAGLGDQRRAVGVEGDADRVLQSGGERLDRCADRSACTRPVPCSANTIAPPAPIATP